jgi:hypothetical protein
MCAGCSVAHRLLTHISTHTRRHHGFHPQMIYECVYVWMYVYLCICTHAYTRAQTYTWQVLGHTAADLALGRLGGDCVRGQRRGAAQALGCAGNRLAQGTLSCSISVQNVCMYVSENVFSLHSAVQGAPSIGTRHARVLDCVIFTMMCTACVSANGMPQRRACDSNTM